MFQKTLEKLTAALCSIGLQEPPIESGLVIDTLSRETFPARPDFGASLDIDSSTIRMAISLGPGNLLAEPSWRLRVTQADGRAHTYWLNEEMRSRLLIELRDQVAKHGRVTELPRPQLSDWFDFDDDLS